MRIRMNLWTKRLSFVCAFLLTSQVLASSDNKSFQESETIINEVGIAETLDREEKGKFPRLERQHTLGAIQRVWDKAPTQSAGLWRRS